MKAKILTLACMILALSACNEVLKEKANNDNKRQLPDWICGKWVRINNDSLEKTYEEWSKINEQLLIGGGCTLHGSDTVFIEQLEISVSNDTLNYTAFGVNLMPTYFHFTEMKKNSFICRNEENEFPKQIKYELVNDTLTAEISDDSQKISFVFVKRK